MTTIQNIEKANYQASYEDVEKMAREQFDATQLSNKTGTTYFRVLLAGVQSALLGKPVLRVGRGSLSALDTPKHLETFEDVNALLYAAVSRGTLTPDVEQSDSLSTDENNRRAIERNRRNNFARTAASTLRKFIRGGGDVRRIAVPNASKSAVAGMTQNTPGKRRSPEETARIRVKRAATKLAGVIEELASQDKKLAAAALQDSMADVTKLIARLAGRPTDKPEVAILDHRLFKTDEGTFWPMTPSPEARVVQ